MKAENQIKLNFGAHFWFQFNLEHVYQKAGIEIGSNIYYKRGFQVNFNLTEWPCITGKLKSL